GHLAVDRSAEIQSLTSEMNELKEKLAAAHQKNLAISQQLELAEQTHNTRSLEFSRYQTAIEQCFTELASEDWEQREPELLELATTLSESGASYEIMAAAFRDILTKLQQGLIREQMEHQKYELEAQKLQDLSLHQWEDSTKEKMELESTIAQMKSDTEGLQQQLSSKEALCSVLESSVAIWTKKYEDTRKALDKTNSALLLKENEGNKIQLESEELRDMLEDLKQQNSSLTAAVQEVERQNTQWKLELERQTENTLQLQQSLSGSTQAISMHSGKAEALERELRQTERTLQEWQSKYNDIESQQASLKQQHTQTLAQTENTLRSNRQELQSLQQERADLLVETASLKEQVQLLKTNIQESSDRSHGNMSALERQHGEQITMLMGQLEELQDLLMKERQESAEKTVCLEKQNETTQKIV
ncbi:hypothetical protein HDU91_003100, partial [Kappamyces sp. JEL0680]